MAKKIVFETEVNAGGVDAGLKMVEAKAAAANGRMNRTVYEAQKNAGALNKAQIEARGAYEGQLKGKAEGKAAHEAERKARLDSMVKSGGFTTGGNGFAGAGGRRNFGAASSMFVSVARDSAASLASGAPITQVIAQQAPQVLQALSMMRLGMVAVGIAAAGVGAFISYKIVRGLYDAYIGTEQLQKSFRAVGLMSDQLANKIEGKLLEAMRRLSNASKGLRRDKAADAFGLSAGDASSKLNAAIDRNIFLTEKKNATREEELDLERRLLEEEARRADAAVDVAKKQVDAAIEVADAKENLERVQQDVDKQDKAMRDKNQQSFGYMTTDPEGKLWTAQSRQKMLFDEQKRMDVLLNDLTQAKLDLAAAQSRNGQPEVDSAMANAIEIRNRILELGRGDSQSRVARSAQFGGGDSLVRVGNFLGSARGKIESLAQKQVEILTRIEINTRPKSGNTATYSP